MRKNLKWYVTCFPVFLIGCAIIYFIARNRAEFNVDIATGIFFVGAILIAVSLTVWNVKSNEIVESHEEKGSV
jgi:hypothetical protein